MEQSPLLKKVYDSYKSEDWKYTQDNLNPVREVSPGSGDDMDELRKKALERISSKVAEIRDDLEKGGIKFSTLDEFIGDKEENVPFGGENVPSGLTPDKIMENLRTGMPLDYVGSPFLPFSPNGETPYDSLISYIEYLIASLGGQINPGSHPLDSTLLSSMISNFLDLGCDNSTVKKILSNVSSEDSKKDSESSKGGSEESSSEEGEEDSSSSSESSTSGESTGVSVTTQKMPEEERLEDPNDIISKYVDDNNRANAKDQQTLMDCAMKDLTWLLIILIILKIISMLVNITSLVMGIISPIIQIATLAAQAWINPGALAEIIQRTVEKAMSIMLKLVADLCQMMWNLLNMDCIAQAVTSALDKLNNLLGILVNSKNSLNNNAITLLNSSTAFKDNMIELDKLIEKSKNNASQMFGLEEAIDGMVNQINSKEKFKETVIDTAKETIDEQFASLAKEAFKDTDAMKAFNSVVQKYNAAKGLNKTLVDDEDNKRKFDEAKKSYDEATARLESHFENLTIE